MYILTVAYGRPSDPARFDQYYTDTHRPLVARIPGVQRFEVLKCGSLDDRAAPYYAMAHLGFSSLGELQAALESPQGQAAAADLANFADGGATLFTQHE
ncbi:EthD family reductase [Amycolatopsis ultiminotia]|uniref:EthD family reductase n=1 Tax=Amycolatopsis ultiminotia TaxID=543629 RepID=A0ABP6YM60_9PSEU